MRTTFAALILVGLIAPASFAQNPVSPQTPAANGEPIEATEQPGPTEPQASSQRAQPSTIGAAPAEPPVQVELPLPPRVTRSITETAAAANEIAAAANEIAAYLKPPVPQEMYWWERWAWGIAFAILAVAAMRLGFRDLNKSVALEREEATAHSYQEMMDDGDTTVERQLRDILDISMGKKKRPTKNPIILASRSFENWSKKQPPAQWLEKKAWAQWLNSFVSMLGRRSVVRMLRPKYWLLWVGGLILAVLALTPDDTVWLDEKGSPTFRFQLAKSAAWSVLDTNFASAFAVTWIAVLFFWGLQSRRLVEAEMKMAVVVEEAKHTLRLAHKDAFQKYLEVVGRVQSQPIEQPRKVAAKHQDGRDSVAETNEEITDREEEEFREFRLVRQAAIDIAIGKPLTDDAELEDMENAIERLKVFAPSWFFAAPRLLADFVVLLRTKDRLPAGESGQLWNAIADGTPREVLDAISKLAVNEKSAKAN